MILTGIAAARCVDIKVPCYLSRYPSPRHHPPKSVSTKSAKFSGYSLAYEAKMIPSLRAGPKEFSRISNSFLSGKHGDTLKVMPSLTGSEERARNPVISAATKSLYTYPPMTSKPKWWWRSLACAPYLLPLHLLWLHADTAYHLHPFLKKWDFLVNPFLDTLALLPNWTMMVLILSAYYCVVRRKEWPHFLRFHFIMAFLLENAYQAIAIACTWLPNTVYKGKLGACFWLAVAFVQFYTVVAPMKCALVGKYADVPVVSDSAYMHADPNMF